MSGTSIAICLSPVVLRTSRTIRRQNSKNSISISASWSPIGLPRMRALRCVIQLRRSCSMKIYPSSRSASASRSYAAIFDGGRTKRVAGWAGCSRRMRTGTCPLAFYARIVVSSRRKRSARRPVSGVGRRDIVFST